MKCTNCDGRGAVQIAPNVKGLKRCPVCGGSGEVNQIEQTNEEWFCNLTTEEKVNALLTLYEKIKKKMRTEIGGENNFWKGNYYREWLKEKHQ